jgi:hypothetical protein
MADEWDGRHLAPANRMSDDIHYRVHAVDGGRLLGFGTGRSEGLGSVVAHCAEIQAAHPGVHLVIRQYDGPAGAGFDYPEGPAPAPSTPGSPR